MFYFREYSSPVGRLTGVSDGENILGLWIDGQTKYKDTLTEPLAPGDGDRALDALGLWLERYFAGEKPAADELPLRPEGSEFRRTVWACLTDIPYGTTVSYGEIARRAGELLGRRTSPRAVGGAVGRNPISIIIPCHRVIGSDGSLTGYGGGLDLKIKLLKHEEVNINLKTGGRNALPAQQSEQ